MNLYRSFGCLLESWVAEGYPATAFLRGYSESQLHASTESVRLAGVTLRSESEDSGVELPSVASAQTPLSDTPTSEDSLPQTSEDKPPSSSSPTPSLCSSSSSSCFSRGAEGLMESCVAQGGVVEQALRRAEPAWRQVARKSSPVPEPGADDGTRQRSHTVSSFRPCHRTGEAHRQPADQQGLAGNHKRTQQRTCSSTDLAEQTACGAESGLSPGLLYLEQVCQVMQEMARLQQLNQRLQEEMETLRDRRRESDKESACLQKSKINCTDTEGNELRSLEEQPVFSSPVFRRRTVSDTRALLQQQNRSKISKSGKFTSTDILAEEPESIQSVQETKPWKVSHSLKLKIGSLRRNVKSKTVRSDSSQSEKTTSIRQLFRNRRWTTQL